MNYIPKYLLNEIRSKVDLVRDPSVSEIVFKRSIIESCRLFCQRHERRAIEKNAQVHSYKMEHPELNVPFSVPTDKRAIKKGIHQIQEAYEWGKRNFNPDNFNDEFIKGLAYRIAPHLYTGRDTANYRNHGVTVAGASVTPPYPEKLKLEIPLFVEKMREQLKCTEIANRIEVAIYAHLHLARIHPFSDGNGRTARALQDTIFSYYNLPLPVIEAGERETYYRTLDKAVYGWKHEKNSGDLKHGATEGEASFYAFMAGKLNVSLDKLLDCLGYKI